MYVTKIVLTSGQKFVFKSDKKPTYDITPQFVKYADGVSGLDFPTENLLYGLQTWE